MIGNTNKQTEITTLYLQISESNTNNTRVYLDLPTSQPQATGVSLMRVWSGTDMYGSSESGFSRKYARIHLNTAWCPISTTFPCLNMYLVSFTSIVTTFQNLSVTSEFSEFQNVLCIFPTRMELNAPHTYILKSLFAT